MSEQSYQDQGSLDQPQQQVQGGEQQVPGGNEAVPSQESVPATGADAEYQTPGVVAPEDQTDAPVAQQDAVPQGPGGGVPTPGPGEVQLPDGSIVPDTEATPAVIQEAQNTAAPAQPAPGGGAAQGGGAEPTPA